MTRQPPPPLENLKGTIERVTFHSEETGFCVLRVKVHTHRELQTIIGKAPNVQPGEFIECQGLWKNDKQHGLQFQAEHLKTIVPTTSEGMEKYLASGMIKGIGPAFAKRLLQHFKTTVFSVIENEPERLQEVEGIGATRQQRIVTSWADQRAVRDIMMFLHAHGVGSARAVRIYKLYGKDAVAQIQANPYCLAHDVHGIGFKTADQLAQKMGMAKHSILRIRAGVTFYLQEHTAQGHCGMDEASFLLKTSEQLEADPSLVKQAIQDEINAQRILSLTMENKIYYFLASLYYSELGIAQHCHRLLKGNPPWSTIDAQKAIEWVESKTALHLSDSQRLAVTLSLKSKVMIITGGPGVGKTTIVNSIIQIVQTKTSHILLAAPTGRAAKRLFESTGREAKTLHRLLEYDPKIHQFKRNATHPLKTDCLVIDECSMIDVVLMNQVLRALPTHAALLLVGDVDQLPSVGPGMVLKNLLDSQALPVVRLTDIFRQAASSKIIVNAHRINKGKMPFTEVPEKGTPSDFYFIPCQETEAIKQKILTLITKRIPARFAVNPFSDIQLLTPTKRGGLGTASFNAELQKLLNPQQKVVHRFGQSYGEKDKVIQMENNYDKDVFNGDIGHIARLDFEEQLAWIQFDDRLVEYDFSELDEIQLAYATTIHKSQGSEYPVVVLPIAMAHYTLLERNLLYTAITRGKQLVVMVGQNKALFMAVKRAQAQNRVTHLTELLKETLLNAPTLSLPE